MIELPSLYSQQQEVRDKARAGLKAGKAVIVAGEPGFGKTRLSKWILGAAMQREPNEKQSGNLLFAVYGRNLVDNASQSFLEDPRLPHGIVMSGSGTDWSKRLQIGSIDTLLSWYVEEGVYKSDTTFDLIVFDEAHAHHSKLAKFWKAHNKKRKQLGLNRGLLIGLSATPMAKGLADVYGEIITGPSTEWLIANGFLSAYRYFRATQGSLEKLVKRNGEYTADSVCDAMKGLSGDLVRDWRTIGQSRPTVGFFPRLSHAKEAQRLLLEDGCVAEFVDADTPDDKRRWMFNALNTGRVEYICNVGVIQRGTNIPAISCVQLCTAIGSVVSYRQMIGRGSRVAEGKKDCIVIDHANNVLEHGFFEDSIEWTLELSRKELSEQSPSPSIVCPQCERIYRGGMCTSCGYEPTAKERKKQGLVFDGSTMREITRKTTTKEKKTKTHLQILEGNLYSGWNLNHSWNQVCARSAQDGRKQGTYWICPEQFKFMGKVWNRIPYGHPDGKRKLKALFGE